MEETPMLSKRELLEKTYEAFNARNMDAVLSNLHPDVDWPNGMEGGRVHGRSGVRSYWERQWAMIDPCVDPLRFEDDEAGRIAVEVHQVVRDLDGNILRDGIVQHVYSINDGLIEKMEIREDDGAVK
jgi:hypothetical protein